MYAYLGTPEAETMLFLPGPWTHRELPRSWSSRGVGDSCPVVEFESMAQALTPLVRMGTVDALLELLLLICVWERRRLRHSSVPRASSTPMTTPTVVPMIRPSDTPFILPPTQPTDPGTRDAAASTSWTLHPGRRARDDGYMSCQEVQWTEVSWNCQNMWLCSLVSNCNSAS